VKDRPSLDAASSDLFAALGAGVFGEVEITRYALRDVVQAHEDIAARRIAGSAILLP
jgi:NADPH2:quinone reductase